MHVEVPRDIDDLVRGLVVAGRYASEQDVVAEAFRLLKAREQLRADVAQGFRQLDEGEWLEGAAVFEELHRDIDAIEDGQLEN